MATTLQAAAVGTLQKFLEDNEQRISDSMPVGIRSSLVTRSLMAAIRQDSKLAACSPKSLINCLEQMVMTGLPVGNSLTAKAYLIAYGKEAQFQIGYKGVKEMVSRSGKGDVMMAEVRAGDDFIDRGPNELPAFHPSADPKRHEKPITYVYAAYVPFKGMVKTAVWSRERCIAHRDHYAKGYHGKKADAWHEENPAFAVMCMKCPLMYLAGRGDLPLSSDVASLVEGYEAAAEIDALNTEPAPQITAPAPATIDAQTIEHAALECDSAKQCESVMHDLLAKYPGSEQEIIDIFDARLDAVQPRNPATDEPNEEDLH